MEIKLLVDSSAFLTGNEEAIGTIITSVASSLDLNPENIEKFIIASDQRYGEGILEAHPNAKFTNSKYFQGVGKTVSVFNQSVPNHRIVLNSLMVELIIKELNHLSSNSKYPPEMHYGMHLLCHELGHCKFNEFYHFIDPSFNDNVEEEAECVESSNAFHLRVLIGELGACYFGQRYKCQALYDFSFSDSKSAIEKMKSYLDISKKEKSIIDVLQRANNLSWVYLIQYAKLAIESSGPDLNHETIASLLTGYNTTEIHEQIDNALFGYIKSDFEKVTEFRNEIEYARKNLLNLLKVLIEVNGDQECCYWN
jgi:hypothetical protein